MTDLHVTVKLSRGELALLEMAMGDMKRINAESVKRAGPLDLTTEKGKRLAEGREPLNAAIAKLERKLHIADTRLAGGVGDA